MGGHNQTLKQENVEIFADIEMDPPSDQPPPAPDPIPSQETSIFCSTQIRMTLIQWGFDETEASAKLSITGLLRLVGMSHKVQSFMSFVATNEDTQTIDFQDPLAFQAITQNNPDLPSYVDTLTGPD